MDAASTLVQRCGSVKDAINAIKVYEHFGSLSKAVTVITMVESLQNGNNSH